MALELSKSKKTVRETSLREVFGKYRGKSIIIKVLPTNEICFRIKGTQQRFTMHMAHAFTTARLVEAKSQHQQAMDDYHNKKRRRKPKKFFTPLASAYVKSILG